MANTKSTRKSIRKTATRTVRNRSVRSEIKTLQKKFEAVRDGDDKEATKNAASALISALDKAVKRGLVHKNKVARKKSSCAKFFAA
jgi:small subunit ribosomal protein S20|tara:strand:+ start:713 stop:970 length:258 start_codon:yes stop_codon:yes gene_type:complete